MASKCFRQVLEGILPGMRLAGWANKDCGWRPFWMGPQRLRLAAMLDGPTKIAAGGHVGWAHKDCGWRPCWMGPQRLRLAAILDGPKLCPTPFEYYPCRYTIQLSPQRRILIGKLIVPQLAKNWPHFMKCECPLPCSQEPFGYTYLIL